MASTMRSIAVLVLIWLNSGFSFAQPLLGFYAGANYPQIPYTHYYDHANVNSKVSFSVGSDFTASFYRNLDYSVGITYNLLEGHLIGYESSISHQRVEDLDLSLGFISLEIMPQYSFGRKKTFYFKAGGYFSFLVNSKEAGTYSSDVINGTKHKGVIAVNARHDYEDIDFGLSAMAGIRLNISDNAWFVPRIGYSLGLYKYNLVGENIKYVRRGGFKTVLFLLGVEVKLDRTHPESRIQHHVSNQQTT